MLLKTSFTVWGNFDMNTVCDIRRHIALRTQGAFRLLVGIQGFLEDVEGGISARQEELVLYQVRQIVLKSLSIHSLALGGELMDQKEQDQVNFDYFLGLDKDIVEKGLKLINRFADCYEPKEKLLEELRAFVDQAEDVLGFSEKLYVLRSPQGFASVLRLAKSWEELAKSKNLPSALPDEWVL